MLKVLDLFSGIGGFSLGLERTGGFRTIAFCEIDPYCQAVLRKHWPEVPIFGDIRGLKIKYVDVVCGGFPCQDISVAGRGEGLAGARSGLWHEFARLIGDIRPRYVIVENVPGLLDGGLGRVLGDLAELGFDAEWEVLPAAAFGSPQIRKRVFIVAYHGGERLQGILQTWAAAWATGRGGRESPGVGSLPVLRGMAVPDPFDSCLRLRVPTDRGMVERPLHGAGWWETGPDVFRVANGFPKRVDRFRAIGNSVVPQITEWIGTRIQEVAND